MTGRSNTVFISYSRDSEVHKQRVLTLSDRLRREGVDAEIDRYVEGKNRHIWMQWMWEKVQDSDYILIVCTEGYLKKSRMKEEPGKGLGVIFESVLALQRLYESGYSSEKIIPVIFDEADAKYIPYPLSPLHRYNVSHEGGYNALYRLLTDQNEIEKPALGEIIPLPSGINLGMNDSNISLLKQFIIFEDELPLARNFVEYLNIYDLVDEVVFVKNFQDVVQVFVKQSLKMFFWLDINLGPGRERDGLEIIKMIRRHMPGAFIVVYSVHSEERKRCMELGANVFFEKNPIWFVETMGEIKAMMIDYLS